MENLQQYLKKLAQGEAVPDSPEVRGLLADYGLDAKNDDGQWQLESPLELLNPKTLESLLTDQAKLELSSLDLHWSLDSTNTFLLNLSHAANFHGYACMAEQQTAGKGRRGRHWVSPFGKNIYLSLGWVMPEGRSLEGLSLAVGCAAARAVKSETDLIDVGLKWPNDLFIEGGKAGGILIELGASKGGVHHLVIGIGINLALSVKDTAGIDQPWSVVAGASRNRLAGTLLSELVACLLTFNSEGFAPFAGEWNALDIFANQAVNLVSAGSTRSGIAQGVDDDGHLLLDLDGQVERINAGEVSLRAADL
jgi:BirA family biotin operon repressor/biotin-[acetyl-CoA-carboxylase] ligase